jgi:hypothetical protein
MHTWGRSPHVDTSFIVIDIVIVIYIITGIIRARSATAISLEPPLHCDFS